jgi:hypothetical protein
VRPERDHDRLVRVKHPRNVFDPDEVDRDRVSVYQKTGEDEQREEAHADETHCGVYVWRHYRKKRSFLIESKI